MIDPQLPKPPDSKPEEAKATAADVSSTDDANEANKLSAEEQLERFEKELKENDWGHQPC